MPSEKDFRRIFVTLQHDRAWAGLMLTPDQQKRFLKDSPGSFTPAAGAWGAGGSTLVHLPSVDEETLGEAIALCWKNAAAKAAAKKTTKAGRAGRAGQAGRKTR